MRARRDGQVRTGHERDNTASRWAAPTSCRGIHRTCHWTTPRTAQRVNTSSRASASASTGACDPACRTSGWAARRTPRRATPSPAKRRRCKVHSRGTRGRGVNGEPAVPEVGDVHGAACRRVSCRRQHQHACVSHCGFFGGERIVRRGGRLPPCEPRHRCGEWWPPACQRVAACTVVTSTMVSNKSKWGPLSAVRFVTNPQLFALCLVVWARLAHVQALVTAVVGESRAW